MCLPRIVIRLRMVQMDLGDRAVANVGGKEGLGVLHCEPNIVQPTLIGTSGRVANHDRQHVDREVIEPRSP